MFRAIITNRSPININIQIIVS